MALSLEKSNHHRGSVVPLEQPSWSFQALGWTRDQDRRDDEQWLGLVPHKTRDGRYRSCKLNSLCNPSHLFPVWDSASPLVHGWLDQVTWLRCSLSLRTSEMVPDILHVALGWAQHECAQTAAAGWVASEAKPVAGSTWPL